MSTADKTLVCSDCGAEFIFTAGEQEFYRDHGLRNEPSRCPSCRAARRQARLSYRGMWREKYPAICASCGKECELPFEPKGDRPVYCSECFSKIRKQR